MLRNLFSWPLVLVVRLVVAWRHRMFEIGRWKSVTFELPTVALLHNLKMRELLTFLDRFTSWVDQDSSVFIPRLTALNEKLSLERIEGAYYISRIKDTGTSMRCLAVRDSLVLGLSESVVQFPEQSLFLIPADKMDFEVRQDNTLLLCRSDQLLWEDDYWPLGSRRESLERLAQANVCLIVDYKGLAVEELFSNTRAFLGEDTLILLVKAEDEASLAEGDLYYSEYGSDFAMDRDTFVGLLNNSL